MFDMRRMMREIREEVGMTRSLIGKSALDERVMTAVGKVPRHLFVPPELRNQAYCNGPVAIGHGQTISQPYMVALMTDLLEPQPDHTILEVGTGSGYQAAVLAQLVRHIHTLEVIPELAAAAARRLGQLGYDNVTVHEADGYAGWPAHAPYDGIIVTAAAPYIPPALVEQLKVGGRLVIPVGLPYHHQELMVISKSAPGETATRDVMGVAFVPLVEGPSEPGDGASPSPRGAPS